MGDRQESVRPRKLARRWGTLSRETNTPEIHRMIWVEKDVKDHPVPTLLPPRCRVVWLERLLAKTEAKKI